MGNRRPSTPTGTAPEVASKPKKHRGNPEGALPVAVSQLTCEAVLGIPRHVYLAHLRAHVEIPRQRLGRLLVTSVSSWVPSVPSEKPRRVAEPWDVDRALAKAVSR